MKICMKFFAAVLLGISMIAAVGCGTVEHKLSFQNNYTPTQGTKVEVGKVVNETGQTFDIDIEKMFADAITEALQDEKLIYTDSEGHKLVLTSNIIEYTKGDAFKRWLMPGWGSTKLSIRCDLKDGDKVVGSADAKRTVDAGGGYTVGAWKTIFASISKDVVKDLKKQIRE